MLLENCLDWRLLLRVPRLDYLNSLLFKCITAAKIIGPNEVHAEVWGYDKGWVFIQDNDVSEVEFLEGGVGKVA